MEIRDRLKDVIISGGENISSVEVESIMLRHPAIQEIAVVGVPHERWGESPHAFVVLKPGASANETELSDFARANMAHFKTLRLRLAVSFLASLRDLISLNPNLYFELKPKSEGGSYGCCQSG